MPSLFPSLLILSRPWAILSLSRGLPTMATVQLQTKHLETATHESNWFSSRTMCGNTPKCFLVSCCNFLQAIHQKRYKRYSKISGVNIYPPSHTCLQKGSSFVEKFKMQTKRYITQAFRSLLHQNVELWRSSVSVECTNLNVLHLIFNVFTVFKVWHNFISEIFKIKP